MSLLFEPSATSFLFEPEANDEQIFAADVLALIDDGSWFTTEITQLCAAPVVSEPTSRALKRLRPRCSEHGEEMQEPTPKRARRTFAARPRVRNKGKIENLRREIKCLEDELESLQHARQDADRPGQHRAEALWKIIAMKQSQERERAECQNKALKTLLSAQRTLTESLSGVLSQWRDLPVPDLSFSV
ncbi:hypothetical protein PHYPSEUDO_013589 [Phytophthora pseudosyringae]|uniref:BZIP domain-containing protein n=1 Tax=Phytophthora pseudosyringae TaxID=221518 RepID=A0A8T1V5W3_9STRA|nr:hypothetical protein PHYPSEUDO_013589 [Phytophthora pseudosyringae]